MINTLRKKYTAELALLLMTIIWGGTFVIVKDGLNSISTMLLIALRFLIASLILYPFIHSRIKKINRDELFSGVILGAILFFAFAAQTVGLKFTTATKSGFLTGTLVVMIPFLQIIIKRTFPTRGTWLGVILVFIGILFLSSGGQSITNFFQELGSGFNLGDYLTIVCAILFALHIIYIDIFTRKYNFWILLFLQLSVAAVLAFIASFSFDLFNVEEIKLVINSNLIFGILYLAILASLINYALQTKFQKEVIPSVAGIIYSFEPIFAMLFAYFLLDERISNFGLFGAVLIFTGFVVQEILNNFEKQNGKKF